MPSCTVCSLTRSVKDCLASLRSLCFCVKWTNCVLQLVLGLTVFHPRSKKPILFYFNILKCANPAVLINLQCPTTQVLHFNITSIQRYTLSSQHHIHTPEFTFPVDVYRCVCRRARTASPPTRTCSSNTPSTGATGNITGSSAGRDSTTLRRWVFVTTRSTRPVAIYISLSLRQARFHQWVPLVNNKLRLLILFFFLPLQIFILK